MANEYTFTYKLDADTAGFEKKIEQAIGDAAKLTQKDNVVTISVKPDTASIKHVKDVFNNIEILLSAEFDNSALQKEINKVKKQLEPLQHIDFKIASKDKTQFFNDLSTKAKTTSKQLDEMAKKAKESYSALTRSQASKISLTDYTKEYQLELQLADVREQALKQVKQLSKTDEWKSSRDSTVQMIESLRQINAINERFSKSKGNLSGIGIDESISPQQLSHLIDESKNAATAIKAPYEQSLKSLEKQLDSQKKIYTSQLKAVATEIENTLSGIGTNTVKTPELDIDVATAKEKIDSLTAKLQETEKELNRLNSIKDLANEKGNETTKYNDDISKLKEKTSLIKAQIAGLKTEEQQTQAVNKKINSLVSQYNQAQGEIEKINTKIKAISSTSTADDSSLDSVKTRIKEIVAEMEQAFTKIDGQSRFSEPFKEGAKEISFAKNELAQLINTYNRLSPDKLFDFSSLGDNSTRIKALVETAFSQQRKQLSELNNQKAVQESKVQSIEKELTALGAIDKVRSKIAASEKASTAAAEETAKATERIDHTVQKTQTKKQSASTTGNAEKVTSGTVIVPVKLEKTAEQITQEVAAIVSKVNANVPPISLNLSEGKSEDTVSSNDDDSYSQLLAKITRITTAVEKKSDAFLNEADMVRLASEDEVTSLSNVLAKVNEIKTAVKEVQGIKANIKIVEPASTEVQEADMKQQTEDTKEAEKALDALIKKAERYKQTMSYTALNSSADFIDPEVITDLKNKYDSFSNSLKDTTASSVTQVNELDNEFVQLTNNISKSISTLQRTNKNGSFVKFIGESRSIQEVQDHISDLTGKTISFTRAAETMSNGLLKVNGVLTEKNGLVKQVAYTYDSATGYLRQYNEVQKQEATLTQKISTFIKTKAANLAGYLLSFASFYQVVAIVRQGLTVIKDLDSGMTELRKVSNDSTAALERFRDAAGDIAVSVGSTKKEIINAAADWSRLGYSIQEASELAKNAAIYVNVGDGIDIDTATSDMVSAMKAFNIEASDSINIIDKYNEVANNFAISSSGIGEALARSSSALFAAGNTIDEAIAMATAMNSVLQDTSTTGTTLKMLALRIRGAKAEIIDMGESVDGMAVSTSKLRDEVKALTNVTGKGGFDIMEDENTFKSTYDIIKGISDVWKDMSDVNQASLLELIAGKNRAQGASALINNFAQAEKVLETSLTSAGSAVKENEEYLKSIQGHLDVLTTKWQEMWESAANRDTINTLIDLAGKIVDIIDKFGLWQTSVVAIVTALSALKNVGWLNKQRATNQILEMPAILQEAA